MPRQHIPDRVCESITLETTDVGDSSCGDDHDIRVALEYGVLIGQLVTANINAQKGHLISQPCGDSDQARTPCRFGGQADLTTQVSRRFIEDYLVPARSTHAGSL